MGDDAGVPVAHADAGFLEAALERLPGVGPGLAGVDVGAREMFVAVPPDRDAHPVQVFDTFTEDLHRLVDWLVACGVTTVAMESTGVYWMPLCDFLEAAGFEVLVVDPRPLARNLKKKTDVCDAAWLQEYADLGFDEIMVHHVGQEQDEFLEVFGGKVLPQLRGGVS